MENWELALVLLVAILVGATLPALFQLAGMLREAKRRMRATGTRIDDTLDELRVSLGRFNRISSGLDGSEHEVAALVDTFGELNQVLRNLTTTAKVASAAGAAIGPAIAAAVRAMREHEGMELDMHHYPPDGYPTDGGSSAPEGAHGDGIPGSTPVGGGAASAPS